VMQTGLLDGNVADGDGGAIAVTSGTLVDTEGSTYTNNNAVQGGAVFLSSSAADVQGASFIGNGASDTGGALQIVGGAGVQLQRLAVWSNTAVTEGGGLAIRDLNDASSVVRSCRVQDNDGGARGGGVAVSGSVAALTISNNTLVNNTAVGDGGGLLVDAPDASGTRVTANIVGWSNGDNGLYVAAGAGATVDYNTGFASSTGVDFAGAAAVDVDDNRTRDPVFVFFLDNGDPADENLALGAASLELDSGPPEPAWNDPNGTRNDRGYTGGPGAP